MDAQIAAANNIYQIIWRKGNNSMEEIKRPVENEVIENRDDELLEDIEEAVTASALGCSSCCG